MRRRRKNLSDGLSDLARQLRLSRPEPTDQFLEALVKVVRDSERAVPTRPIWRRAGLAVALTGLIVVAIASFGGIGYAGSAASDAVKKVQRSTRPSSAAAPSAAEKEYGPVTPPSKPSTGPVTPPSKPSTGPSSPGQKPSGKPSGKPQAPGKSATAGQKSSGGTLPFTGLALWIPLAAGLVLIGFGLLLRNRGRRRESTV